MSIWWWVFSPVLATVVAQWHQGNFESPFRSIPELPAAKRDCAYYASTRAWIERHGAITNVGTDRALERLAADAKQSGCPI